MRRVAKWAGIAALLVLAGFGLFCAGGLVSLALAMSPQHAPAAGEVAIARAWLPHALLHKLPFVTEDAARPALLILAHGDAEWIMRGNYRAATGEHCCGVSDCGPVPANDVRHVPRGYVVRGHFVPMAQTLPSMDGQFWACVKPGGIRCFFAPLMG